MTDIVAAAAAAVDYDSWVMTDDGHPIPQSTTDYLIHNMLVLLGIAPGQRILEIGTGSGYSGAVIAKAVGDGHVVSIDIDPGLVERAASLHRKANHANVEVHAADGFLGWAPAAPYDGVIAWTTPHVLPQAWIDQTADQGVIVTPVKLAEVAGANAVVRCVVSQGQPREGTLRPGSFIELAPEVITDFALPIRYVDASRVEGAGPAVWISAVRLHGQPPETSEALLEEVRVAKAVPDFLTGGRTRWEAFTAFVLARTDNVASVGSVAGTGLGVADTTSVAVVLRNGSCLTAGSGSAGGELRALLAEWIDLGLDYSDLTASFTRSDEGWTVRPKFKG